MAWQLKSDAVNSFSHALPKITGARHLHRCWVDHGAWPQRYAQPRRFSMASISIPVMETGNAASISRMHVGLVTLTSVSLSPIMSSPTKIRPLAFRAGPTRRAISQSLSLSGRASPRPPAARLPRVSPPAEYAPGNREPVRHRPPERAYHRL